MAVLLAGWRGTAAIRRACLGKRRLLQQEELSPGVETHVSSCREPEPEIETLWRQIKAHSRRHSSRYPAGTQPDSLCLDLQI